MKRLSRLSILFFVLFVLLAVVPKANATEMTSGSSAALVTEGEIKTPDSRAEILRKYLEQYNSPLVAHAETFVKTADKYNLDWKLVAAISGVESTFGQHVPSNSFNGWGWGIYGDHMTRFSSWEEGIETVSEGLRNKYINTWRAQDVYSIGEYYAASPTWAQRVVYFMDSIDKFKNVKLASNLSVTL